MPPTLIDTNLLVYLRVRKAVKRKEMNHPSANLIHISRPFSLLSVTKFLDFFVFDKVAVR